MLLTEQDSGRSLSVNAGSNFVVRLRENQTTGYRWMVTASDGLDLVSEQVAVAAEVGGGTVHEFQFQATRKGFYRLELRNQRDWEEPDSVSGSFTVTIAVS